MSLTLPIYLDHNATTPVDARVFEVMRPYFCETFGNAASRAHAYGWAAETAVDTARQQVAAILNGNPNCVVWTTSRPTASTCSRLPHVSNLSFGGVDGDTLLAALADLAVSSGSACTSASLEPSYVLRALGVPNHLAFGSVRFSLGRPNTEEQIDYAIEQVTQVVGERARAPR